MSGNLALITCGFDLQEEHIAAAIGSREETRALLSRLAVVAAPDSGVAKVLLVYARMATTACEWLDGDLCIDLVSDADATSINTFTELGGGLRERLFPAMVFRAPLAEFARSISRASHMISPLVMRSTTPRRIRLSATEIVRRTTVPPPLIAISTESMFLRMTPPVSAVDAGAASLDLPLLPIVGRRTGKEAAESLAPDERSSAPAPADAASTSATRPPALSEPPLSELDRGWDE